MDMVAVSEADMLLRLTLALLFGLLVGAERSRVGKRAGMRTYALVALGSALFTIVSTKVAVSFIGQFDFDPLRVASQIIVGIGFLGAGVIFSRGSNVSGLTTAAGLWVVAGVGMATGFGMYLVAAFVTFVMLFVFEILWYVEDRFIRTSHHPK